jgi:hypothetical protein
MLPDLRGGPVMVSVIVRTVVGLGVLAVVIVTASVLGYAHFWWQDCQVSYLLC